MLCTHWSLDAPAFPISNSILVALWRWGWAPMRWSALRACCVAAAVLACGGRALAQALEPDTPQPDGLSGGTKVGRVLLYAGFDIWRYGRSAYGGFYWAPDGLNKDGFITRLFVSGSAERYDAGSRRFNTNIIRVAPLAGWWLSRDKFE